MNCLWLNPERGIEKRDSIDSILKRFKNLFLDESLKNDGKDEMLDNPYLECFGFDG